MMSGKITITLHHQVESNDIPCSPRASAANVQLAEVEECLQFLTCPQGLSDSDFCKFM
jgi:hypothetical protein